MSDQSKDLGDKLREVLAAGEITCARTGTRLKVARIRNETRGWVNVLRALVGLGPVVTLVITFEEGDE